MFGICGFNFENKTLLKKMCDLVIHRGPDDFGYFTDSSVSIGVRRLSIIDLNTGHQPQHNENEDIWIIHNGEIYNYLELREILEKNHHKFYTKSDTEVIIHSYEQWGEECVKKLRGQFAFCIYDSNKKIFFLARDFAGLIPLYYYFDGDIFVFGSEIKCILCHDIIRELDLNAFNLFLSLRYTPFNNTLFKGIFKLPLASYLKFNLRTKEFEIKKYDDVNFKIDETKDENTLAKELRSLLEESIKIRMRSDVPLGAFLSGGIDSSTIVGIMSKLTEEPIKTFSIGFEQGAPTNETPYAQLVSDYFNTDHKVLTIQSTCYDVLPQLIWHLDDLISDPAIIPIYYLAKLAREKIKVAFTGDGADEIFAGYAEHYWLYGKKMYRWIPKNFMSKVMNYYTYLPSHKVQVILSRLNSSIKDEDRFFRALLVVKDIEKNFIFPYKVNDVESILRKNVIKNVDLINQFAYFDIVYQLPNRFNMKADKMSMAASLEARVPFLDKEIIKWSTSIPTNLKLRGKNEKYILKLAVKDLLPPQILARKKLAFGVPVVLWLKKGMNEVSSNILERLEKRKQLIRPEYVEKVKKNRTSIFYHDRVWTLMMFELWYETFFESDGFKPISY